MIYKEDRIAILIDGPNFHATAKKLDIDVDYKRLLSHFTGTNRVIRTSYFTAINQAEEFQPLRPLLDFIQYNGWNVVTKDKRKFTNDAGQRRVKGNMSVEMSVEAIAVAHHVDHVVLFSGDRDFCPLVQYLPSLGIRVSVASSLTPNPAFIADDLRRQADAFIELDNLRTWVCRSPRAAEAA